MADSAPLTLARGVWAAAARWPGRVAVEAAGETRTYGMLARRIAQTANAAAGLGLVREDRVALIAPNRIDYMETVLGLAEAGTAVATLSDRLTQPELETIFDDCEPRAVIIAPGAEVARAAAESRGLPIVTLGAAWQARLERASDTPVEQAREADGFALAYTSGTTGTPKGVVLSHRSRALTFLAMAAEYGCFGPRTRFLTLTPMAHGAGFAFAAAPLFFGGTCVLFDGGDPEQLADRLAQPDLTGVFVVPTHLARLAALPAGRARRGAGLRAVICNAAALPQRLKQATVERLGPDVLHETYGSTEAGIVANIRPDEILERPGSVGTPFPLTEVSIRRPDGCEAAAGESGELFARGPYAFNGYWRQPEATAQAVQGGWITVGDTAARDADGFITIGDRLKDMIVTGGMNVYPKEVEQVIAAVPGVRDAAVVGVPDPDWGEAVHAFVVGDASPDDVIAAARTRLAAFKVPKGVTVLPELPRNASGKLLKRRLRDLDR